MEDITRLLQLPPDEINARLCRQDFSEFVKESWHIIEPSTPLIWGWAMQTVCDHVQALVEGRLIRNRVEDAGVVHIINNLICNVPPGSSKSTIVSVCLPAWIWCQHPGNGLGPGYRMIFASGNEHVALRDSMKCRSIMISDWYQKTFKPKWKFSEEQNTKFHYVNSMGGFRLCLPAGANIVGLRGDLFGCDDPNEAESTDARLAEIQTWWDSKASNRVNNLATSKRILIQQRLDEGDLTGHVKRTGILEWDHLIIRAEFEQKDPPTGLGWQDPRTVEGELFATEERFPRSVIESEKKKGNFYFAGQYQQRPAPASGGIFKKGCASWFNPGDEPAFSELALSFDTAFKDGEENDFSVGLVCGITPSGYYLLERWKEKVQFPRLMEIMNEMIIRWKPSRVLIEDKASGQSAIQQLKLKFWNIEPIKVKGSKAERARATTKLWEQGQVWLPKGASWTEDFLENIHVFNHGLHDDDVDAMVQLLNYYNLGFGHTGILDYWRQQASELALAKEREDADYQDVGPVQFPVGYL